MLFKRYKTKIDCSLDEISKYFSVRRNCNFYEKCFGASLNTGVHFTKKLTQVNLNNNVQYIQYDCYIYENITKFA